MKIIKSLVSYVSVNLSDFELLLLNVFTFGKRTLIDGNATALRAGAVTCYVVLHHARKLSLGFGKPFKPFAKVFMVRADVSLRIHVKTIGLVVKTYGGYRFYRRNICLILKEYRNIIFSVVLASYGSRLELPVSLRLSVNPGLSYAKLWKTDGFIFKADAFIDTFGSVRTVMLLLVEYRKIVLFLEEARERICEVIVSSLKSC